MWFIVKSTLDGFFYKFQNDNMWKSSKEWHSNKELLEAICLIKDFVYGVLIHYGKTKVECDSSLNYVVLFLLSLEDEIGVAE